MTIISNSESLDAAGIKPGCNVAGFGKKIGGKDHGHEEKSRIEIEGKDRDEEGDDAGRAAIVDEGQGKADAQGGEKIGRGVEVETACEETEAGAVGACVLLGSGVMARPAGRARPGAGNIWWQFGQLRMRYFPQPGAAVWHRNYAWAANAGNRR